VPRELDGHRAPVRTHESGLTAELAACYRPLPLAIGHARPAGDVLPDRAADDLVARVARELQVRAVDVEVASLLVEQHHRIARALKRAPEQRCPSIAARHPASLWPALPPV
jgi:hypothetical protein